MKIAVTDLETVGGFRPTCGQIVEVGIAVLDTCSGVIDVAFSEVCREHGMSRHAIAGSWIFANSSLTVREVMTSPNVLRDGWAGERTLFPEIQKILDEADGNTAYNSEFDFGWLRHRGFRIERQLPCLMRAMTGVCRLPRDRGGYKYPKFEEAVRFAWGDSPRRYPEEIRNVWVGNAHRAGADAAAEAALLRWMLEQDGLRRLFCDGENPDAARALPSGGLGAGKSGTNAGGPAPAPVKRKPPRETPKKTPAKAAPSRTSGPESRACGTPVTVTVRLSGGGRPPRRYVLGGDSRRPPSAGGRRAARPRPE